MILPILLLLSLSLQLNEVSLRTGISQLNMGSLTLAQYTILFKTTLPDPVYNSLVGIFLLRQRSVMYPTLQPPKESISNPTAL